MKVVMNSKKKEKKIWSTRRKSNYCMFFMEANRSKVF